MIINVKTMSGTRIILTIDSNMTIDNIKDLIEKEASILKSQQRLVYMGRILDNSKFVKDYNIESNDHLMLMLMLRGG
jgi:ubiquitin-large subunit ribosomal protein L40e